MRKLLTPLFALVIAVLTIGTTVRAQNPPSPATASSSALVATRTANNNHNPVRNPAAQELMTALSSLPEADTLIYVNPQRILNEVAPKLMSPTDLEGMRKGFEEVKKHAGIDPQRVEYFVLAVRFRKPTADLQFQAPEFLLVSGGDFSAESLMTLARMASQGKLREEKYGDKTLGVMTIDPMVKQAEKFPLLRSFTEVAVASVNGNTIAAGSPAYLKAALDASAGKDRINIDTLNSLVRDPNALISAAGTPWHSFAKSFGILGTEGNPRAARCESKIGDFYAALTMDATNFMLRGAMNEDNPDTAKIVSSLLFTFLKGASGSIKDPTVQSVLNRIAISAEGDEVIFHASIPQQTVLEMMKPKPKQIDVDITPGAAKKPVKPRRKTRRRG